MPFYEYRCEQCDHCMEVMQKMNEAPLKVCPECGQTSLRKLISAAAFHLKGTGWYATDFKGGKSPESQDKKDSQKEPAQKKNGDSACHAGGCPACTD